MSDQKFPTETFLRNVVQLLDTFQYNDTNYPTREEYTQTYAYAYSEAAKHFSQPRVIQALNLSPDKVKFVLETITSIVVNGWSKIPQEVLGTLTIYHCYIMILDDMEGDLDSQMKHFSNDLSMGNHPWLSSIFEFLPSLTKYYGPYCAFNGYRSIMNCKLSIKPSAILLL